MWGNFRILIKILFRKCSNKLFGVVKSSRSPNKDPQKKSFMKAIQFTFIVPFLYNICAGRIKSYWINILAKKVI